MNAMFRVWARPAGGTEEEDFIYETFDAKSDAEKFFADLQKEDDNILDASPSDSVTLGFDEFYSGQWVRGPRKLVRVR